MPSGFKEFAPGCRYHRMRRGLLLLVTSVAGTAVGAIALAACLPATPAPSPTTTTKAAPTTTTTRPASGSWAQNGSLGTCTVFPADNAWNRDVSTLPVDTNSANYLAAIAGLGGNQKLHADFGGAGAYGIPYITVPGNQTKLPVDFTDYGDESDPGPYPIPTDAPVEGGSDAHVLAVDRDHCKLYELFAASPGTGRWSAASGAVFDLTSNALRPEGWTSADAAGLPIFPGLVRYDEVASGHIDHALRFTVSRSQRAYLHPATHWASSITDAEPAADGTALPAEGELRRVGLHRRSRGSCWTRSRSTG